jgi:hypothetical protein
MDFDADFATDGYGLVVGLWASEPIGGRVRFLLDSKLLVEELQGGNPVHDERNIDLCRANRTKIEAACRTAFAQRPAKDVGLTKLDFSA